MSFIRRKVVKGKVYLYEVESYRDPQTGKVRQRYKGYVGRDPRDKVIGDRQRAEGRRAEKKLGTTTTCCCSELPPLTLGDQVRITLTLDGEWRELEGVIIPGSTQVPACAYPRKGRVKHEIVRCPYDPPGSVTVQFEWSGKVLEVQMPRERVRRWNLI